MHNPMMMQNNTGHKNTTQYSRYASNKGLNLIYLMDDIRKRIL